jgi:hypothetical protein
MEEKLEMSLWAELQMQVSIYFLLIEQGWPKEMEGRHPVTARVYFEAFFCQLAWRNSCSSYSLLSSLIPATKIC